MPANSNPPYSHGLEVDDDANLYLTYYDKVNKTTHHCMIDTRIRLKGSVQ